jgi:hypothetical protein
MTEHRTQTAYRSDCQAVVAEGLRGDRKMFQSWRDHSQFSADQTAINRLWSAINLRSATENRSQTLTKRAPQS